jgi:FlaG/FlaF family flagellin (archaellin)
MRIAFVAIVVVLVGIVGYVVIGAQNQKASPEVGALAANTAVGADRTASERQQLSGGSTASRPAVATSRPGEASADSRQKAEGDDAGGAMAAVRRAVEAKKHLFVFVHDKNDDRTGEIRKTFDAAVGKMAETVRQATVNRDSSSESAFVEKYGLKSAPMPVVLVFAPNGAIVAGILGERLNEQQLLDALASPAKQMCMKALQERKVVFLCVQNGTTKSNDTATRGVEGFKADARFAEMTEIVKIDPADAAEKKFLGQLQIDPKADQATTVFLAPPGVIVGKFSGATDKDKLVVALQAASSGCSGKSGCCPPKR